MRMHTRSAMPVLRAGLLLLLSTVAATTVAAADRVSNWNSVAVSASVMLLTSGAGAACSADVSSVCQGVAEALWNQPAAAINTTR